MNSWCYSLSQTALQEENANQTNTGLFLVIPYPMQCYPINPLEIITTADNFLHGWSEQNSVLILGSVRALLINQRGISLNDTL